MSSVIGIVQLPLLEDLDRALWADQRMWGDVEDQLWDDPAFKARLRIAAKRKGTSVAKALLAVGASRNYLDKPIEGRSTNTILKLARHLEISPALLMGIAPFDLGMEVPKVSKMTESERLQQLKIVAKTIALQLAALVYCTSDRSDADPAVLMKFVLQEINGNHSVSEDIGGKGM